MKNIQALRDKRQAMKTDKGITVYVAQSEDDKDHGIWHIDASTPERIPRSPRKSELWED